MVNEPHKLDETTARSVSDRTAHSYGRDFAVYAEAFVSGSLLPEDFVAICDAYLADRETRHYPALTADILAFRAAARWRLKDAARARDDAMDAITLDSRCALAHQVLLTINLALNKHGKASMILQTLAGLTEDRSKRDSMKAMAKELSFRAGAVDAAILHQAFARNENEANTWYAGRELAVTGIVLRVDSTSLGWPKVILAGYDGQAGATCLFAKTDGDIPHPVEGEPTLIAGYCKGLCNGLPQLTGCRILQDP